MTRPTARVLALLEILQSGGTHPVAALAERLGVDERTVRRYVTHLLDLEVPVHSIRGRHGGYRLAPGFRMPPLMLTDEEALAAVLSLEQAGRNRTPASPEAAGSAAAKIRRVLPTALADRLEALLATATTTEPTARPAGAAAPEAAVVLLLAEAARNRRPVDVDYTTWQDRRGRRRLHPYGIVAHAGRWYLTAEDPASGQVRTFRLDRLRDPRVLDGSFEVPDGFDPTERVLTGLAELPRGQQVSVLVQADPAHLRDRLPPGLATIEPLDGDDDAPPWVRVRLRAERLDWVPAVLAALDRPLVVEHPDALRDGLHAFARRLLTAAETTPGTAPREG